MRFGGYTSVPDSERTPFAHAGKTIHTTIQTEDADTHAYVQPPAQRYRRRYVFAALASLVVALGLAAVGVVTFLGKGQQQQQEGSSHAFDAGTLRKAVSKVEKLIHSREFKKASEYYSSGAAVFGIVGANHEAFGKHAIRAKFSSLFELVSSVEIKDMDVIAYTPFDQHHAAIAKRSTVILEGVTVDQHKPCTVVVYPFDTVLAFNRNYEIVSQQDYADYNAVASKLEKCNVGGGVLNLTQSSDWDLGRIEDSVTQMLDAFVSGNCDDYGELVDTRNIPRDTQAPSPAPSSPPSETPPCCSCLWKNCVDTPCCEGMECVPVAPPFYSQCKDVATVNDSCTAHNRWFGDGSMFNPFKPCCNPNQVVHDGVCMFGCEIPAARTPTHTSKDGPNPADACKGFQELVTSVSWTPLGPLVTTGVGDDYTGYSLLYSLAWTGYDVKGRPCSESGVVFTEQWINAEYGVLFSNSIWGSEDFYKAFERCSKPSEKRREKIYSFLNRVLPVKLATRVHWPTPEPTSAPTFTPSYTPSYSPTFTPTETPTDLPTESPTGTPTDVPTPSPSTYPTYEPTEQPTEEPTDEPTAYPTTQPTDTPTDVFTTEPTDAPTAYPTTQPTDAPTYEFTTEPTDAPTTYPTTQPTDSPTYEFTAEPTDAPTSYPTTQPTDTPTYALTAEPTGAPTAYPTEQPTDKPTYALTAVPTDAPTAYPTTQPTDTPTYALTAEPTGAPTAYPTEQPTDTPTTPPTDYPVAAPSETL